MSGAKTFSNWATLIKAGPANESTQTVTFSVTGITNPGIFSVNPSVNSSGCSPAPYIAGTATITLVSKDNGGTANGGVNTSTIKTFVINLFPNHAPSFNIATSHTSPGGLGCRASPDLPPGLPAGLSSESGQTVTFSVTGNTYPGLFSVQPSINSTGKLTYIFSRECVRHGHHHSRRQGQWRHDRRRRQCFNSADVRHLHSRGE